MCHHNWILATAVPPAVWLLMNCLTSVVFISSSEIRGQTILFSKAPDIFKYLHRFEMYTHLHFYPVDTQHQGWKLFLNRRTKFKTKFKKISFRSTSLPATLFPSCTAFKILFKFTVENRNQPTLRRMASKHPVSMMLSPAVKYGIIILGNNSLYHFLGHARSLLSVSCGSGHQPSQ